MKRLMVLLAAGLLAGGLLAGCSGSGSGSEAAPLTVELSSTTSSTAAPTTTSTTEATTTTLDPNIALVEAAYRGYFEAFLPASGLSADSGLEAFATDPHLTTLLTNINTWIAEGSTIGENNYDIHVIDVSIDGERAVLRSCDLDAVALVSAAGDVLIEADTERYRRQASLEFVDGVWKIASRGFESDVKTVCVPE